MPIKERSFRIGCGRYLQEKEILKTLGYEVKLLGHAPLIIGGKTALSVTRKQLIDSVSAACPHYRIEEYCGTCNDEKAIAMAELARSEGFDVIVGVGGGVIMDLAKLIGHFASLPVINIPTSSATCAAYTPLSVRYTADGRTVGTKHYEQEVDAVLVDVSVLMKQPPRLLLSGMFDAIAKFVEIKHRFAEESTDYPLGLDWAYTLSVHSYNELFKKIEPCLDDMRSGTVSNNAEQVIFTTVAVTGVISGIARGSNQTALAHKFYEATRTLFHKESRPYLHGEIVGIGLLLQNKFNGETERNQELLDLMRKYRMPCRLSDIGIDLAANTLEKYYEILKGSSAITESYDDADIRLREALEYLWNL